MTERCQHQIQFAKILIESWKWFCEAQPDTDLDELMVAFVAMNLSAVKARQDNFEAEIEAMKQQLPIGRIPDDRYN